MRIEPLMEERIKTLSSLQANHFRAELHSVRLRTGRITERIKIYHPEAAAVVPFVAPDRILMVSQWRYAIERETLEIPAGKCDPGEDLETCAMRELEEETGYRAEKLFRLFGYFPAIGYSNEMIAIYAAAGLTRATNKLDEDEISGIREVPLDRALEMAMDGELRDGKTVLGLTLYRMLSEAARIPEDFLRCLKAGHG